MKDRDLHHGMIEATTGDRPTEPFSRLQAVLVNQDLVVTDEIAGSFTGTRLLTWATEHLKEQHDIDHQASIYQRDFHSLICADDGTQRLWFLARY